jgi:predicted deacylase
MRLRYERLASVGYPQKWVVTAEYRGERVWKIGENRGELAYLASKAILEHLGVLPPPFAYRRGRYARDYGRLM